MSENVFMAVSGIVMVVAVCAAIWAFSISVVATMIGIVVGVLAGGVAAALVVVPSRLF